MEKQKNILFIDDQYYQLANHLLTAKNQFKINFFNASSIQDGMSILKTYYKVMDAVILDVYFERNSEQGIDGLREIVSNFKNIPVYMLVNPEVDFEKKLLTECLKNGAIDFMTRTNFEIEHLLNKINNDISLKIANKKLNIIHKIIDKSSQNVVKFTTIDNTVFGMFGYKLNAISIPKENNEKVFAEHLYKKWHAIFIETAHLSDPNTRFEIKYHFAKNNSIAIEILFIIEGFDNKIVLERVNKVNHDFSALFSGSSNLDRIFNFTPITKNNELNHYILSNDEENKCYYLSYPFTKNNTNFNIGFQKEKAINKSIKLPNYLINNPISLQTLIEVMDKSSIQLSLTIQIDPVRLTSSELSNVTYLKDKLGEINNLENDTLLAKKLLLREWINLPNEIFGLNVYLETEWEKVPAFEKSCILHALHCNEDKLKPIEKSSLIKRMRATTIPIERMNLLIGNETVNSFFRLPFIHDTPDFNFNYFDPNKDLIPDLISKNGIKVGRANEQNIYIEHEEFNKHTYILGRTGIGKTSILTTMLNSHLTQNRGFALIDPHGDLYDKVLTYIPEEAKNKVICFDPSSKTNNWSLNIIEFNKGKPEERSKINNELLKIIGEIYDLKSQGGPMFERYFRMMLYLATETIESATLQDVLILFEDSEKLKNALKKCKNEAVNRFFNSAFRNSGDTSFENFAQYINSKFNRFVDDDYLGPIINNRKSNLNFREIIDDGKILIVKLSKAKLGDLGVKFMGRILFNRLIMAAYSREDISPDKRIPYTLFVDEFQNFTSDDINTALAEARKYRLNLVMANQTMSQLNPDVRNFILGNVGSIISGGINPTDAKILEMIFQPSFSAEDLIALPKYKFAFKTFYEGQYSKPFKINSLAMP